MTGNRSRRFWLTLVTTAGLLAAGPTLSGCHHVVHHDHGLHRGHHKHPAKAHHSHSGHKHGRGHAKRAHHGD